MKPRPKEKMGILRPTRPERIMTNERTALVLCRGAYKLEFLVRAGLGWQRDVIPPIKFGDLGGRNSGLFEPRLVAFHNDTWLSVRHVGKGGKKLA